MAFVQALQDFFFEKDLWTFLVLALVVFIQAPIFFDRFGWYTKKRKRIMKEKDEQHKKKFEGLAKEFADNYSKVIKTDLKDIDDKLVSLITADKDMMRNEMMKIYYKYKRYKMIPEYDYEVFSRFYTHYIALGGNSFIQEIKEKINSWDIVKSIDEIPQD